MARANFYGKSKMKCLMLGIFKVAASWVNMPTAVPPVETQLEQDIGFWRRPSHYRLPRMGW